MISKITRTRIKGRMVQSRATAKSTQANSLPSILTTSSYDSSSDGGKEVDEESIASDNTRQVNNMSSHSHSSHLPHYHYGFQDDVFDAKLNAMFTESNPSRDNSAVINNDGKHHPMYIEPLPLNSVSILDAHDDSRNHSEQLAEFGKLLDHLM